MYENETYEALKEEMLKEIALVDKREGSFVNDMLSTAALQGERLYVAMEHALAVAFLKSCTGEDAEEKAQEEGLTRKAGTKAKGEVTFTGEAGKEIPAGTLVGTASGLFFVTMEAAVTDEGGTVTVEVEAESIGDNYNVLAGYINNIPVAVGGATAVTNASGTLGGSEEETDAELVARTLLKKRTPATSGNAYHYLQWALEVDGIGNARVFPLDNGAGTVGVMPITSSGRAPDSDILEAVKKNIEAQRPIGADVSVYAPTEVMIQTAATVTISSDTTIAAVKKAYTEKLEAYIKGGVFLLQVVDYYKCLSLFYEIAGVVSVQSFAINGEEESVSIGEKQIQVMGEVLVGVE